MAAFCMEKLRKNPLIQTRNYKIKSFKLIFHISRRERGRYTGGTRAKREGIRPIEQQRNRKN